MTATDQVASKLLEIINQIQAGVVTHAPDAINMVLQTIRISAIGNFMVALAGILVIYIIYKIYPKIKHLRNDDDVSLGDFGYWMYCILSILFSCLIIIGIFMQLFDIWQYIAIFNPKLYLAHEIIQKVMQ